MAGISPFLDKIIVFASSWLGVLAVVFVFLIFWIRKRKFPLYPILAALVARGIFVELIRFFYDSPRPFEVIDNVKLLLSEKTSSSFPSGHAAFFFALAFSFWPYSKKGAVVLTISAVVLSLARVIAGVHLPGDVVGGAILALLITFNTWLFKR